ncbi:MAG: hypothetical protein IJF09_04195 [Ruminiclostridium sp.]|nr:hypothetical protein [Ruminiclostridium sp.]
MGTSRSANSIRSFGATLLVVGFIITAIVAVSFWITGASIEYSIRNIFQPMFVGMGIGALVIGGTVSVFMYFLFVSLSEIVKNTEITQQYAKRIYEAGNDDNSSKNSATALHSNNSGSFRQQALSANNNRWTCQKCSSQNSYADMFCQNCGANK